MTTVEQRSQAAVSQDSAGTLDTDRDFSAPFCCERSIAAIGKGVG
jgi:hypothetical protein